MSCQDLHPSPLTSVGARRNAAIHIVPALLVLLLAGCRSSSHGEGSIPSPNLSPPIIVANKSPSQVSARTSALPPPRSQPPQALWPAGWVPPVPAHNWKYIIIHHSATPRGSAASFDRSHRRRGWDELGYHFVIGNGTDTSDGQVEVGSRWAKQKHGAHAGVQLYNEYGIGICLVGDFSIDRPTAEQMQSLARLVFFLTRQHRIPPEHVLGHRHIKATDCPGRFLDVGEVLRRAAAAQLDPQQSQPRKR